MWETILLLVKHDVHCKPLLGVGLGEWLGFNSKPRRGAIAGMLQSCQPSLDADHPKGYSSLDL